MMEIYCIATGTVQGVAFRAYVQDSATELGLRGLVENLPDGSVAIVAQGEPDVLKDFVEYLHEGSLQAKVDAVAIDWRTPRKAYDDFSITF